MLQTAEDAKALIEPGTMLKPLDEKEITARPGTGIEGSVGTPWPELLQEKIIPPTDRSAFEIGHPAASNRDGGWVRTPVRMGFGHGA